MQTPPNSSLTRFTFIAAKGNSNFTNSHPAKPTAGFAGARLVIMPDHFHLIITPAEEIRLEKAVQYIEGGYATAARRELGLSGVWQPKPNIAITFLIIPCGPA